MAHRARASFWTAGCPPLPASAPDRDAAEVLEYELPSRGSLSTSGQSVAMKFRTTERREDTRTAKSGHAPPKGRHSNPKGGQKRPKGGQKRPKSGQKRPKSGHPKVRRIILFLGGTAFCLASWHVAASSPPASLPPHLAATVSSRCHPRSHRLTATISC